jgi:hypothetical protein
LLKALFSDWTLSKVKTQVLTMWVRLDDNSAQLPS